MPAFFSKESRHVSDKKKKRIWNARCNNKKEKVASRAQTAQNEQKENPDFLFSPSPIPLKTSIPSSCLELQFELFVKMFTPSTIGAFLLVTALTPAASQSNEEIESTLSTDCP